MSSQGITTHSGIAHIMQRTLQSYGLNSQEMFLAVGLASPDSLTSQDRVQAVAMQQLWRLAVEKSGDEAFGISFAEQVQPMALHGLGFSWMASDSLKDAFKRLVRYYRLISSAGEVILEEQQDGYKLWYKLPAPKGAAAPASLDAAMALFVQLCRLTKSMDFKPSRVELQRQSPADRERFDHFFGCPISYNSNENCLFFDAQTLEAPLPGANPELARANDQVVIDYLKAHDKQDIINQLRALIIESLPSGEVNQDNVASNLHMSTRSMQRKLKERNTSFKHIVEEVRIELAKTYLSDPKRSIGEATYLLGYSEPTNFSRSFKKWTGRTPAEFQLAHRRVN